MKVVALVSGGKDSCYVMLKCLSYGHEITALAHITPPATVLESDSFMYQSVGSAAVPKLAEALALPLYTRETSAKAVVTSLAYSPKDPADEVEDLVALLKDVKRRHPDIQAVCAGALWSDYQRLRVESAASRVGLLSMAFLWRRDQRELLDEMIEARVHAVVVKVAAVGLGESDLGKSLGEVRQKLLWLEETYGVHPCGEGGEFETLVLSLPTFRQDMQLERTSVVRHSDDPVAPVLLLNLESVKLVPKANSNDDDCARSHLAPVPAVPFALRPVADDVFPPRVVAEDTCTPTYADMERPLVSAHRVGRYLHVVVRVFKSGAEGVTMAASALRAAIAKLSPGTCEWESCDPLAQVLYIWLRLSSLSANDYARANKAYSSFFGTNACTPPPVRACVGMRTSGAVVTLEALARLGRRGDPNTETLHVQSLSEWAPPCIGPYAQTVTDLGVVHICGVVPLHAPTASIPKGLGARAQTRACMYNMACTLEATRTRMNLIGFVAAYVVCQTLAEAVEEELRAAVPYAWVQLAIVPVHALPKGALVEVRAVAVERGEGVLRVPIEVGGGTCAVGRLRFSVVEYCGSDVNEACAEISRRSNGQSVLSLQAFCLRHLADDLEDAISKSELSGAKLVARVDWLAHEASVMCIITAVADAELLSTAAAVEGVRQGRGDVFT